MPSRRFHHKSSAGCQECKQQRVKCDERRPSCARCVRQERSCSYTRNEPPQRHGQASSTNRPVLLHPARSAVSDASSISSAAVTLLDEEFNSLVATPTTTPTTASAPAPTPTPSYNPLAMQDLELLHYWTLHAAKSFVTGHEGTDVWQNQAVRQALRYPFLMHAIFSFSALHLVSTLSQDLAPSRDAWLKRSSHDYALALQLSRAELDHINAHNCHAIFAFTSIVAIYRLALPGVTGSYGEGGVLEHTLSTIHLLRGILAVLKNCYPWVKAGPLGSAVVDIDDFVAVPIAPDIEASLDTLRNCVGDQVTAKEARLAYYDALARMKSYFTRHPEDCDAAYYNAVSWPVLLQAEFMDDLAARKPLALVILGYYAVILDEQHNTWWMVDQSKRLLISVLEELKPHGQGWIDLLHSACKRVKTGSVQVVLNYKDAKSMPHPSHSTSS